MFRVFNHVILQLCLYILLPSLAGSPLKKRFLISVGSSWLNKDNSNNKTSWSCSVFRIPTGFKKLVFQDIFCDITGRSHWTSRKFVVQWDYIISQWEDTLVLGDAKVVSGEISSTCPRWLIAKIRVTPGLNAPWHWQNHDLSLSSRIQVSPKLKLNKL